MTGFDYIPLTIFMEKLLIQQINHSFYPYTQARRFTQLPNWGRNSVLQNDVRKDYLVAKN